MAEAIGERMRKIRNDRGLTQKELGQKAGIAEPTIRRYELGKLNPKIGTLRKIADALGVDVADLDDSLSSSISAGDLAEELLEVAKGDEENRKRINNAYSKLNAEGRAKAVERMEELTEIKRFCNDPALYDKSIQKLKELHGDETIQKILDHANDIKLFPDTTCQPGPQDSPAGQGKEEPEIKK